jgi:stearoyl-CoA desaturase (delta-9 desaturase)
LSALLCFDCSLTLLQSTFCVNSLAHWLGDAPFDDKHTPRDHVITALVTIGEGYHNFHHQFPMDYRNAIKSYQYDPTKWTIWTLSKLGLASHLKVFPENEVRKGQLTMQLKRLREVQEKLVWPSEDELPVIDWASCTSPVASVVVLRYSCLHSPGAVRQASPGSYRRLHPRRRGLHGRAPWRPPPHRQVHRQGRHDCVLRWCV